MNAAVTGLTCSVCGTHIDIATPFSWKCPNATNEDRKHVLRFDVPIEAFRPTEDANPFLAYRSYLAVDAFGEAIGLDDATREGIIRELDDAVKAVDGVGFTRTPMHRADALSDALGFTEDGGIWWHMGQRRDSQCRRVSQSSSLVYGTCPSSDGGTCWHRAVEVST